MHTTHTVGSTKCMLPVGNYEVKIIKRSARKQYIAILRNGRSTDWKIGIGLSWMGSKKNRLIAIGERLIPGSVYKAVPIYERLIDRLIKCESRGEGIQLIITDYDCIPNRIINHWIEPDNHYCPPSNRRVEQIEDRHYDIFDGDVLIKHIVLPERPLIP